MHLILTAILWGWYSFYPHFSVEETWATEELSDLLKGIQQDSQLEDET